MRILRIQNPDLDQTYKTLLGSDYAVSDGTAMTVLSTVSFSANDILAISENFLDIYNRVSDFILTLCIYQINIINLATLIDLLL